MAALSHNGGSATISFVDSHSPPLPPSLVPHSGVELRKDPSATFNVCKGRREKARLPFACLPSAKLPRWVRLTRPSGLPPARRGGSSRRKRPHEEAVSVRIGRPADERAREKKEPCARRRNPHLGIIKHFRFGRVRLEAENSLPFVEFKFHSPRGHLFIMAKGRLGHAPDAPTGAPSTPRPAHSRSPPPPSGWRRPGERAGPRRREGGVCTPQGGWGVRCLCFTHRRLRPQRERRPRTRKNEGELPRQPARRRGRARRGRLSPEGSPRISIS